MVTWLFNVTTTQRRGGGGDIERERGIQKTSNEELLHSDSNKLSGNVCITLNF